MADATSSLFDGFMVAGFECSDQRLEDGRRLDLLTSTQHDRWIDADYARLRALGIRACREGVSWVHCERSPRAFDFSRLAPRVDAARRHGLRVAWDLMHFGWPDDVDVFATGFPARFGRYAAAVARWFADHGEHEPLITPINEMSFLAWAGGDVRCLNPFAMARGVEFKAQLVLASIEAIEAIRAVSPRARFLQPEPLIRVIPDPSQPRTWRRVACDDLLQFQAWDMLAGRVWPRLGGDPRYLDIVGVNVYPANQFTIDGTTIERGDARYHPLAGQLLEVAARYGRPLLISETGSEDGDRAPWLRYVADECATALRADCDLHGLTLYPVLNHPGWLDDRHCRNGIWDYADAEGHRVPDDALAEEVRRQGPRLADERAAMLERSVAERRRSA